MESADIVETVMSLLSVNTESVNNDVVNVAEQLSASMRE
jgi:hypothetical protein